MKQHPQTRQQERRVQTDEIFVYLGSLVILLALTFLVVLNWAALTGIGRILTVFVPTAAILGLGEWLRPRAETKFQRGAQADCTAVEWRVSVIYWTLAFFDL